MDACEFIHIGIVGEAEMFSLPEKARIQYNKRLTKDEGETVESMYKFSKENPDYKVLFFMQREQVDSLFLNYMHGEYF